MTKKGSRKKRWSVLVLTLLQSVLTARAESVPPLGSPEILECRDGLGRTCSPAQLTDPQTYRQVLIYSGGFTPSEKSAFTTAFERLIVSMSAGGSEVYSAKYAGQLLYIPVWVPGGPLGSQQSSFKASVVDHPVRGRALTVDQAEVMRVTDRLIRTESFDPWSTAVLFNTHEEVTANAAPPAWIKRNYGIARFTLANLESDYVPTHEIAHASLNFLDEYIESGFQDTRIQAFDVLSPLLLFNGTKEGRSRGWKDLWKTHDFRVSDILAANGNENIDVSRYPSRVQTEGYAPNPYEFEGGMFFGKGTWHDEGDNLMNSHWNPLPGNGFAYAHSRSQQEVIRQVFETPLQAPRPNDRIRNAGPDSGKIKWAGKAVEFFVFDADKNHRYHPTLAYEVQLGWWEKGEGQDEPRFRAVEKRFPSTPISVELHPSRAMGLGKVLQKIVCEVTSGEFEYGGDVFDACVLPLEKIVDAFVPTWSFPAPYQALEWTLPERFETYYWRFRTDNGTWKSGWTGWSKIKRGF
jgi:hypothetical protein